MGAAIQCFGNLPNNIEMLLYCIFLCYILTSLVVIEALERNRENKNFKMLGVIVSKIPGFGVVRNNEKLHKTK
jgi:hypothetical protein